MNRCILVSLLAVFFLSCDSGAPEALPDLTGTWTGTVPGFREGGKVELIIEASYSDSFSGIARIPRPPNTEGTDLLGVRTGNAITFELFSRFLDGEVIVWFDGTLSLTEDFMIGTFEAAPTNEEDGVTALTAFQLQKGPGNTFMP